MFDSEKLCEMYEKEFEDALSFIEDHDHCDSAEDSQQESRSQ
jgi:hypothetical protein